jgi:ABC-type Zn2+ transport system substrate-binding protein/surface adhesin
MHDIILSETDTFDLLLILQGYAEAKSREIEQALKDEKAGKRTRLFDNYADFIAALEASQNHAKKLLKDIQQQTRTTLINEQAIDRL